MNRYHLLVMRPKESLSKIKVEYTIQQKSSYSPTYLRPYGHSSVYRIWAQDDNILDKCYELEKHALEEELSCLY
jgi:hypothetical protein